jgi:hypothetical protein
MEIVRVVAVTSESYRCLYDVAGARSAQSAAWPGRKDNAAIAGFRKALQIDPAFGSSYLNPAMALVRKGDSAGALERLQAAVAADHTAGT